MKRILQAIALSTLCYAQCFSQSLCNGEDCCGEGTIWNPATGSCQVKFPADVNLDDCVGVDDILTLLSFFENCYQTPILESPCENTDFIYYHGKEYSIQQIGNECWFAENLATPYYQNGDSIHIEYDGPTWCGLEIGSGSAYNFSYSAEITYGRIYNFHAASDPRKICPVGWHVSSEADIQSLISHVGGADSAAYHLRGNAELWNNLSPEECADPFGFNALPGGGRDGYYGHGNFSWLGNGASYWVAEDGNNHFYIAYDEGAGIYGNAVMTAGHYIRCVADQ